MTNIEAGRGVGPAEGKPHLLRFITIAFAILITSVLQHTISASSSLTIDIVGVEAGRGVGPDEGELVVGKELRDVLRGRDAVALPVERHVLAAVEVWRRKERRRERRGRGRRRKIRGRKKRKGKKRGRRRRKGRGGR